MREPMWQLVAMLLFLLALPALSAGTENDAPALWITGLLAVTAAAAVPVVLKFAPLDDEES